MSAASDGRSLQELAHRLRAPPTPRGSAVLVASRGRQLVILSPADGRVPDVDRAPRAAGLAGTVHAGVAGPSADPAADLVEADLVLGLARRHLPGTYRLDDVLFEAMLATIPERVQERLRARVASLYEKDPDGSPFTDTIRAVVRHDGVMRHVAETLDAHRNTIAYRLHRIHELTGLDPHVTRSLWLLYAGVGASEALTPLPHDDGRRSSVADGADLRSPDGPPAPDG